MQAKPAPPVKRGVTIPVPQPKPKPYKPKGYQREQITKALGRAARALFAPAVMLALLSPAAAQESRVFPYGMLDLWNTRSHYAKIGDPDLDRAVAACAGHEVAPTWVYPEGGTPPDYTHGWDACHLIHEKWAHSDAARQAREAAAKDEEDRAFVDMLAKSMAVKEKP